MQTAFMRVAIAICLLSNILVQPAMCESINLFPLGSDVAPFALVDSAGHNFSLESYLGQNRIALIFVPNEFSASADGYLSHLIGDDKQLEKRDLKVIVVAYPESELLSKKYGTNVVIAQQSDQTSSVSANATSPLFVLIGKDKTVKLHELSFVDKGALFGIIDSMPMRRAEMKAREQIEKHPAH